MNDLIRESTTQLAGALRTMVEPIAGGRVWREEPLSAAIAGVPLFYLNSIVPVEPVTDLELPEVAARAAAMASGCPGPWMLAACHPWMPADAGPALAAVGLHPGMTLTGMVAAALEAPRRPLPTGLEFRTGASSELVEAAMDINCRAYGLPREVGRASLRRGLFSRNCFLSIGYSGRDAVSAAATFPVDGCLYTAWVATVPEAQGQGFGEAVLRDSLANAEAGTGIHRAVLHATPAGLSLYRAMGYEPICEFTVYVHP